MTSRRPGPILSLAAALLALSTGGSLAAESLRSLDGATPVRGTVSVDGKQIPLPDGDWRLAGRAESAPPGGADSVGSFSLLRLRGDRVDAAVLIQVANPGAGTAWGKAPGCERTDLPLARVRYASDHDGSCAWVAAVAGEQTDTVDPAWRRATGEAEKQGWSLPRSWAVAGFRINDPLDAIQVRYAFGDAAVAAPALPDAAWIDTAWPSLEQGFRNRLPATTTLPDWNPGQGFPPPLANADQEAGFSRTVWKTITFRSVVTTLDFSSNYIALGEVAAAASLSAFGFVIGPFVYIGHELAWEKLGGPTDHPVDLPGIGTEQAGSAGKHAS